MEAMKRYGADARRLVEASRYPELYLARVVSQSKDLYSIVTAEATCLAKVAGKLRYGAESAAAFPAVGDFVMVNQKNGDAGEVHIEGILPRRSVFVRKAAGSGNTAQVVAANIDTVFVCMALTSDYNRSRIERYLSIAWDSGATPVVVLTKADLCADLPGIVAEIAAIAPGTDVLTVSRDDPASVARLTQYLAPGKTASLIGSSGVGKSTLVNLLLGESAFDTADVRKDGKGRHTTTRRELVVLPEGGIVIDTPGMRELGAETVNLSRSFADIEALAAQCRFSDCTHGVEPGCAVRRAIEDGTLEERRLASYEKLARETRYDDLSAKQREKEKLAGMFAAVGGMKNARKYIRDNDKRKER